MKAPTGVPCIAPRRPRLSLWISVALLLILFAQAVLTASRTSLTYDEGLHITSGYSILRTGDYRLVEEHPPLVKLIETLPLLPISDLPDVRTLPGWESNVPVFEYYSTRLIEAAKALVLQYHSLDALVFATRVPVMLLAVLLGAVTARWATDWWGWKGGSLALVLLAFDPNIVAHSSLTTVDLGATCFITLALFSLARFLRRPTRSRLMLAGVSLGLAQASKLSALPLLPIFILFCLLALRRHRVIYSLLILLIAALTLWTAFGFEIQSVAGAPFPIPAASYRIPILRLREHILYGHEAFLMGKNSTQGWWYYFLVAFVIKTPLPTLLLLGTALVVGLGGCRLALRKEGLLLTFPVVYGALSLSSPINIGYRHLLPVLPSLFVLIARLAVFPLERFKARLVQAASVGLVAALLAWLAFDTVRIFPDYLAFFNQVAGGPENGYKWLVDSNLDWGQNFKELKTWLDAHGISQVFLSHYDLAGPEMYGIQATALPPTQHEVQFKRFSPAPGWYVIGATTLQGAYVPDVDMYAYFRAMVPVARIGYALFVYHVLEEPLGQWVAQCTNSTPPLDAEAIQSDFTRAKRLQLVQFDCTQGWWYPAQALPGWYVDAPRRKLDVKTWYPAARLVFQPRDERAQFVGVYRVDDASPPPGQQFQAVAAAGDWLPAQAIAQGAHLRAPVSTTGPLQFEGFWSNGTAVRSGGQVMAFTAWRVTRSAGEPLSIMAHLLDAQGRLISQGDGLAVPTAVWQTGDLIVQAHSLNMLRNVAPGTYWIETGVYRLDNMARYQILQNGQAVGDRLLLTSVEVKP